MAVNHYDVIVIGTGAGGGTLAHALAPTGKRILLLERGDYLPREKDNWRSEAVWGQLKYRNAGKWRDKDGREFTPGQHYYVGGNTKFYGAVLARLREEDFGEIKHHDGVSPAWPLSYLDFEPYYGKAEALYQVHGKTGIDPTEPPYSTQYFYPAVSHEPRIQRLSDDLQRIGLHPYPLPVGVMLNEAARQFSPCIRCETCDGFPCLVNAKSDAQVIAVDPALRSPNVELVRNARALRLDHSPDGRRVTSVWVQRNGETESYSADVVVVSCGAINSAALLLQSRSDLHPMGLANSSGVVGRHFMRHNNSSLVGFSHEPNPTLFQKTLGVNDFYFGSDDWDYPLGHMQMLGKSDADTVRGLMPDAPDPEELARHTVDFWFQTEDLPLWDSRVTVDDDGTIRLSYAESNAEAHDRLIAKFKGLLNSVGCKDEMVPFPEYAGGKKSIAGVSHQCGTVRFGSDPTTSALDLNCRAHDLDNLYVVDSSFFPSSGSVNPTLTIIANALRVADHLEGRLMGR
jgi:choline dehydrogenase-like flavoprotein